MPSVFFSHLRHVTTHDEHRAQDEHDNQDDVEQDRMTTRKPLRGNGETATPGDDEETTRTSSFDHPPITARRAAGDQPASISDLLVH